MLWAHLLIKHLIACMLVHNGKSYSMQQWSMTTCMDHVPTKFSAFFLFPGEYKIEYQSDFNKFIIIILIAILPWLLVRIRPSETEFDSHFSSIVTCNICCTIAAAFWLLENFKITSFNIKCENDFSSLSQYNYLLNTFLIDVL